MNKPVREKRNVLLSSANVEVRSTTKGRIVEGYSPKWNTLSEVLSDFRETFRPYAFTDSLKAYPDVQANYAHLQDRLIGRVSSGTLKVRQDETGLYFSVLVPKSETVLLELLERQDITAASFEFALADSRDEQWSIMADGTPLRAVSRAVLYAVSLVSSPAYPDSKIGLRNAPKFVLDKVHIAQSNRDDDTPEDDDIDLCQHSDDERSGMTCSTCSQRVVDLDCRCETESLRDWTCNDCGLSVDDDDSDGADNTPDIDVDGDELDEAHRNALVSSLLLRAAE